MQQCAGPYHRLTLHAVDEGYKHHCCRCQGQHATHIEPGGVQAEACCET